MTTLTARQQECFDFIRGFIQRNALPPSVRDIITAMKIKSPNGATGFIRALIRKGYIEKPFDHVARGIRLVGSCPTCGK